MIPAAPADRLETRIVAKSTDSDYYAFPSVCRLQSGELLCTFYKGTGHVSADGKIVIVRSADDGRTWSKPEVAIDTKEDDRDPSIMQTRSGRVIVNFFVYDGRTTDPAKQKPRHSYTAISDDGGKTFAKPSRVETGWYKDATSDEILELPDSTLLMPIYGMRTAAEAKEISAVVFSKDGGKTWGLAPPAVIAADASGKMDFQEPAIALLPDGTVICSLRTTNAGFHAYESISRDGGKTWSTPGDTGLLGHAAGLLYHSSGLIFQAYRSWTPEGSIRGVAGVFTKPGTPWNPTKQFDIMLVGGDVGYPSAVELADGTIYCVYYAREHRSIEAAVISPTAIASLR